MAPVLFHLAFPVTDMAQTKAFYVEGLGCDVGRETPQAIILNLYGHQLVGHRVDEPLVPQKGVYPRHFGLVFSDRADWQALLTRVEHQQIALYQSPKHRFAGTLIDHETFFLADPFDNLMEFKVYAHAEAIFGGRDTAQIGDRAEPHLATGGTPA